MATTNAKHSLLVLSILCLSLAIGVTPAVATEPTGDGVVSAQVPLIRSMISSLERYGDLEGAKKIRKYTMGGNWRFKVEKSGIKLWDTGNPQINYFVVSTGPRQITRSHSHWTMGVGGSDNAMLTTSTFEKIKTRRGRSTVLEQRLRGRGPDGKPGFLPAGTGSLWLHKINARGKPLAQPKQIGRVRAAWLRANKAVRMKLRRR